MSGKSNQPRDRAAQKRRGLGNSLAILAALGIGLGTGTGCYRKVVSARGIVPPGVKIEEPNNPESRRRQSDRPAPVSRNTPLRPMKPIN